VKAVPADDAPPHTRPYLLYVGHRAGYKNFRLAVEAYAASPALREAFDFVTFGGFAMADAELEWIARLGLRADSVVRIAGSDLELARAYRHARMFVYPSRYEGFGIPPLEAMSSGCPVACSDNSSIPEVVGDAAVLFDAADGDSIRDAMERVGFDESLRARLIEAGHARVRQFSWDQCVAATMAVYRRMLHV
jgi:glycosyltransferase involved in cell wall biosynthesis